MSQVQPNKSRKSTKQQVSQSTMSSEVPVKVEQVEQPQPVVQQQAPVKSAKTTVVQQPVAETVPVVVSTPAVSVSEPVVSQASSVPPVQSTVPEVQEVNHFENLNSKLKQVQSLLRDLTTELNVLQKEVDRLKKSSKKQSSKSRANRKVNEDGTASTTTRSGINKEVNVSEDLARFLGIDKETKVSRIQVSRAISEYINKHNLQKPENRRIILLDDTLSKLLNPPQDVTLSYFNLQTYLKPHYRQ